MLVSEFSVDPNTVSEVAIKYAQLNEAHNVALGWFVPNSLCCYGWSCECCYGFG